MKRKTTVLIITLITAFLILSITALAAMGDKPETHDTGWLLRHGKVSAIDESECLSCHTDRLDCIRCHEDTKPRDHTSAYVNRGHAQKAMWSRNTCAACHTDSSFCDECHEVSEPSTHIMGWGGNLYNRTGDAGGQIGRHCVSCHTPATMGSSYGNDHLTRGCKTCHTVLQRNTGGTHPPR
jgi:hypothetical protein